VTATGTPILDRVVAREPMVGHDGRSGAALERVVLDDGTRLVVKVAAPQTDLAALATDDAVGREIALWSHGVLDRLPAGVGHALVDGWRKEDGTTITVMRDIGEHVVGWRSRVSRSTCRRMLDAVARMHRAFMGAAVEGLCPLATRLTLLSPQRIAGLPLRDNPLPAIVARGWELFADAAPTDVWDAVVGIQGDPAPLATRLCARGSTMIHGDFGLVNLALEPEHVTLLDWNIATAAPPAVEVALFLAACASGVDASREQIIDDFRIASGEHYDDTNMRLALIAGVLELGWNKAVDAVEHPDPRVRAQERADLGWWIARTREALELL
jgi:hypothetical protein